MELSDKTEFTGVISGSADECSDNPEASVQDAVRLCQALLSETEKARKKYNAVKAVDIITILPLIGLPFGFLRTVLLSEAGDYMERVNNLCIELSDVLPRLDITADLEIKNSLDYRFKDVIGDYKTLNYSTDNYMNEAFSQVKVLKKKITILLEQLIKQTGPST